MNPFFVDDVSCHIHFFGDPSTGREIPVIVLPVMGDVSDLIEGQHERLNPVLESEDAHVLVTFAVKNWNDDLSPWQASAVRRSEEDFGGNAAKTLEWIHEKLIPEVVIRVPSAKNGRRGLLGYSMAGLFAVWAATKSDAISVFGSGSGSLWFEGFAEYVAQNAPIAPCFVYLSLGDREEFTRNPTFAKVGDATREIYATLKASPTCRDAELVFHPGKHTGAVGERLAAAHLWMRKRMFL